MVIDKINNRVDKLKIQGYHTYGAACMFGEFYTDTLPLAGLYTGCEDFQRNN